MARHLVLVGGGHAHLTTLVNLREISRDGHRVTLVSPVAVHHYSGMGPGMLGGSYSLRQISFPIKDIALSRDAAFVQAAVEKIDPGARTLVLSSGALLDYDVVSFNTGSCVPLGGLGYAGRGVYPVKPIERLLQARQDINERPPDRHLSILVIGGGAAGVEMAGNIWRLLRARGGSSAITLVGGRRLLPRVSEKVRTLALQSLTQRDIDVREGCRVARLERGRACLSNGETLSWDVCFAAQGVRPSPVFQTSGLPTGDDGGLLVNRFLQSSAHPEIFGGGDCISFQDRPLDKVGVYAVRQNPVLFHNLRAALRGEILKPFRPQKTYLLLLNLGNGKAIFCKGGLVGQGRMFFYLKDYIDRAFMRRFQSA